MKVWLLDGCCDSSKIEVLDLNNILTDVFDANEVDVLITIPGVAGPVGPVLVDVGSVSSPALITSSILAPVNKRQRSFIVGSGGPSYNPSIANPAGAGPWELYLFCTSDTNTVTLEDQSNLLLSGQWIGSNGSILYLQWDGVSRYVEGGRNEI